MLSELQQRPRKLAKVKQACDCCHARKIRCDGNQSCVNCQMADLRCTYLAMPKKKGPKGQRMPRDVGVFMKRKERPNPPNESGNGVHSVPRSIESQIVEQCQLPAFPIGSATRNRIPGFRCSPLLSTD